MKKMSKENDACNKAKQELFDAVFTFEIQQKQLKEKSDELSELVTKGQGHTQKAIELGAEIHTLNRTLDTTSYQIVEGAIKFKKCEITEGEKK